MRVVADYLGAVRATARRDAAIFATYRFRMVGQVLTMLFSMAVFYYVSKLVRPGVVGPHGPYFAYVVVGIVGLSVLTAALNIAQLVRMELLSGTFERMLMSPVGAVGGALSLAVFPVLYAIGLAAITLVAAAGIYGFPVHAAEIPAAIGVSGLAALAFICFGLLFVAGLFAFKSALGVGWVFVALSVLGGVYFPVRLFPVWLRWVSEVQPFTPAVYLLRHLLLGSPSIEPVWLGLVKLGAFTVVLMPISVALLRLSVERSRRRGTLMEY